MSNTSKGRKYHPCPTPSKYRPILIAVLNVIEIIIWLIAAAIALGVIGKWLGV